MTTEAHITPEDHSDIVGGSTAARRIGCPRSYALEQLVPKVEGSSSYAQEGTALHELMAMTLSEGVEPTDMLPYTFTAKPEHGGWSHTITAQIWADKGEPALAAFDAFCGQQEMRLDDDMKLEVENRVAFPGIPGAFGTADIIARCRDEIFIMDWKFGSILVPAKENKQLMFYATGALNTMRDFFGGMDVTEATPVTLVILQPARDTSIDVWTTTVGRLEQYVLELQAAVREAETKGVHARCEAGSWCKFARCAAVCEERIDPFKKLAQQYDRLQTAFGMPPAAKAEIDWAKRYGELLDLADACEPMIKAIRSQAHEAMDAGQAVEGWVVELKRAPPRTYAVDDDVVIGYMRDLNYEDDDWMPRKLPTLPQLEKILKHDELALPPEYVMRPEATETKVVRASGVEGPDLSNAARIAKLADALAKVR